MRFLMFYQLSLHVRLTLSTLVVGLARTQEGMSCFKGYHTVCREKKRNSDLTGFEKRDQVFFTSNLFRFFAESLYSLVL